MELPLFELPIILIFIMPFEHSSTILLSLFKLAPIFGSPFQIFEVLFGNDLLALAIQVAILPVSRPDVGGIYISSLALNYVILEMTLKSASIRISLTSIAVFPTLKELPKVVIVINHLAAVSMWHTILPLPLINIRTLQVAETPLPIRFPVFKTPLEIGALCKNAYSSCILGEAFCGQKAIVDDIAGGNEEIFAVGSGVA